jgi:eukaryotic-like serine/threonine-protein kinase
MTVRFGSGSDTAAGSVLGTPAFMPPEQATGEIDKLDKRVDVFGLGAILCVILTGKPPYVAETSEIVRLMSIRGHLKDAFARLDACGADAELVALCKRCLAAERDERLRNAGEVADEIGSYLSGVDERIRRAELERASAEARAEEESNTRRVAEEKAREEYKRRWAQLGLAAAIGLLLVAGGAFGWWQDRQATAQLIESQKQERDEGERRSRNANAVTILLDRCEESIRANDSAKAAVALEAADKRMTERGAEELIGRLERLQTDSDGHLLKPGSRNGRTIRPSSGKSSSDWGST